MLPTATVRAAATASLSPAPEMVSTHTQYLTRDPYIAHILQRLHKEQVLVHVRPPGMTRSFNSAVLEVNTEARSLALDELTPHAGHRALDSASPLHIHARLEGVQIHFDTRISAIEYEHNIALYRTPFPEELIYRQRRRHFRAMLADPRILPIVLPLPRQRRLTGQLIDISIGGLCSRIDADAAQQLQRAQAIHAAQVELPGRGKGFRCDLAVRCVRHYPQRGYSLVGSEIIDIARQDRQMLERLVARQERARQRRLRL